MHNVPKVSYRVFFQTPKKVSPFVQEMLAETVVEMLPPDELQPLLEVVSLMATIVLEPWAQDNKMNPRTLGIACGLSIFPSLDPGIIIYLCARTNSTHF